MVCCFDLDGSKQSLCLVVSQPPARSSGRSYLGQAVPNPTCCDRGVGVDAVRNVEKQVLGDERREQRDGWARIVSQHAERY